MNAYKGEELLCMAITDTDRRMVASSSVDQDDQYWSPFRAFTNGYLNGRAAKVKLGQDIEWTLLSCKAYRSIESECPLRQAEEIPETKTGVRLFVAGKASIALSAGTISEMDKRLGCRLNSCRSNNWTRLIRAECRFRFCQED